MFLSHASHLFIFKKKTYNVYNKKYWIMNYSILIQQLSNKNLI